MLPWHWTNERACAQIAWPRPLCLLKPHWPHCWILSLLIGYGAPYRYPPTVAWAAAYYSVDWRRGLSLIRVITKLGAYCQNEALRGKCCMSETPNVHWVALWSPICLIKWKRCCDLFVSGSFEGGAAPLAVGCSLWPGVYGLSWTDNNACVC